MTDKRAVNDKSEFDFEDNARWFAEQIHATHGWVSWVEVKSNSTFNRQGGPETSSVVAKLDLTTEAYAYKTQEMRDYSVTHGRHNPDWPKHIKKPDGSSTAKPDYLEITRQIVGGGRGSI